MIARGFKSVVWVAAVGGAALGCYMLSLQVATERADLAKVERQIIATKQQIRSLQTELGTRGRLSQLEQWNSDVLALSAPATGQFLKDEFLLARLDQRDQTLAERAEMRMASMDTSDVPPAAEAAPAEVKPRLAVEQPTPAPVQPAIVHRAGYTPAASRPAESRPVQAASAPAVRPPVKAASASARPVRRLGAELADQIGAAARDEKAARASTPARREESRAAVTASRDDAVPARSAHADSARPKPVPAKASGKPAAQASTERGRSASGVGGQR
ncbi:MAG TPA: hypothetical protein VK472_04155 [Allosphingosinicella sp.]|nr:hypothetical protein [Allosphingosinicella sp.]